MSTSYYAIAIGKEQKITQDWLECLRLTNGYKGNKYKKFKSYEEAESWLLDFNLLLNESIINNFEIENKLVPSFINKHSAKSFGSVHHKTEIFISGDESKRFFQTKNLSGDLTISKNFLYSCSVSSIISTLMDIHGTEEEMDRSLKRGDHRIRNYILSETSSNYLFSNRQSMYINLCTKSLDIIYKSGIRSCSISTDSYYLSRLLTQNIFENNNIAIHKIENDSDIVELYEQCHYFDTLYVSYYSSKASPEKLLTATSRSAQLNKEYLDRSVLNFQQPTCSSIDFDSLL